MLENNEIKVGDRVYFRNGAFRSYDVIKIYTNGRCDVLDIESNKVKKVVPLEWFNLDIPYSRNRTINDILK